MLGSPEWTRTETAATLAEDLEPSLSALVQANPGAPQIIWLLSRARIRALGQLEALTHGLVTADKITGVIFKLAKSFTNDDHAFNEYFKTAGVTEEDVKRDTRIFFQTWSAAFSRLAADSRRIRSHGIMHAGEDDDIRTTRQLFAPSPEAPSALSSDYKRRRICPAEIAEIMPPPPAAAGPKPSLAAWEQAQKSKWVYRMAKIAQRAGNAAGIWSSLEKFEVIDRDKLWADALGAGEWRTTRAVCFSFEALERWAQKVGRHKEVFPAQIELLVQ